MEKPDRPFISICFWIALCLLTLACSSTDGTPSLDGDLDPDEEIVDGEMDIDGDGEEWIEEDPLPDGDEELIIPDGDVEQESEQEEEAEPQALHLLPLDLPTTPSGQVLEQQFEAMGGQAPYSNWRIALGDEAHGNLDGLPLGQLPPGTSLDPDSGLFSGSPSEEGFFYFVIAVDDSEGQSASRPYGILIADPAQAGPMAARAAAYQEVYETRHFWNGFSLDAETPDGPDNDYQLTTLGDATFVSGQCTMAMAFRNAVLQSPESLDFIGRQINGWRFFQRLTGVPGLIGRSFFHKDDPVEDRMWVEYENQDPEDPKWYKGEGEEFEDFYWRGDTSRDQAMGAMLGMIMAHDMVDDAALKQTAADFITELVDHVLDHDLTFVDPDGLPTTYGDMSGERLEGWPIRNGQAAACLLSWLKAAHRASGEARYLEKYEELLVEQDYLSSLKDYQWVYSGYGTKWYNTYMSWEAWYHLMRLEDDLERIPVFREIFRDTLWLNTEDSTPNRRGILEHNAVKTPWYLFTTGEQDSEALFRVLWQMDRFPEAPLRDHAVHNSSNPDIVINPEKSDEALYALPIDLRREDMVRWHRGPYLLDGGNDNGRERTGCDYLLPYWMGRYYKYIQADW